MRVLVVGGSGMIGAAISQHLRENMHDVLVGGRTPAGPGTVGSGFPHVEIDYRDPAPSPALGDVEGVVLAAGQDVRHVGPSESGVSIDWEALQSVAVPRFFSQARAAGVRHAVQVGSYYHQVRPDLVATVPYVRARQRADIGAGALSTAEFSACTVNPPSVIGVTTRRSLQAFGRLVSWADGDVDLPLTVPPGGTNYMSARSLAAAVEGALLRGEPGCSYLVGDQNLSFADYFSLVFAAAGSPRRITEAGQSQDVEHPMVPSTMQIAGYGARMYFTPNADVHARLEYPRGDVPRAIGDAVAAVRRGIPDSW